MRLDDFADGRATQICARATYDARCCCWQLYRTRNQIKQRWSSLRCSTSFSMTMPECALPNKRQSNLRCVITLPVGALPNTQQLHWQSICQISTKCDLPIAVDLPNKSIGSRSAKSALGATYQHDACIYEADASRRTAHTQKTNR